jgi:hypothetical protein
VNVGLVPVANHVRVALELVTVNVKLYGFAIYFTIGDAATGDTPDAFEADTV